MPESSSAWRHRRATQRPSISPRRVASVRVDYDEIDRGQQPGRTCCPVTAHRDSFILDWLTQVAVGLLGRDSPARVASQADRSTRWFLRAHITLWHGEVAPLSSAFLARAKTLLAVRGHSRPFRCFLQGEREREREGKKEYRDSRCRKPLPLSFSSLELVSPRVPARYSRENGLGITPRRLSIPWFLSSVSRIIRIMRASTESTRRGTQTRIIARTRGGQTGENCFAFGFSSHVPFKC